MLTHTLCKHVMRSVTSVSNSYLVSDHFHADHEAFSTDVTDNLILVSEFCELRHQIGAHMKTVLLRALLSDSLISKKISVIQCAAVITNRRVI